MKIEFFSFNPKFDLLEIFRQHWKSIESRDAIEGADQGCVTYRFPKFQNLSLIDFGVLSQTGPKNGQKWGFEGVLGPF